LGVNPVHFFGAYTDTIFSITSSACSDVWARHDYQKSDQVSRQQLLESIMDTELEFSRFLGFHIGPQWNSEDVINYPKYHRPDARGGNGRNVSGNIKSVAASWKKFISQGRRTLDLIGAATTSNSSLVYSDEDGDGFAETATIIMTTTVADPRELHAYISGTGGDPRWEIREPRYKTISGGVATIAFDSWLFIDPALDGAYPRGDDRFRAIDIGTTDNYVTQVDLYREYTDTTATSAQFYWGANPAVGFPFSLTCPDCSGTGCASCNLTTQTGCIHVRDVDNSIVAPQPAAYNADTGVWDASVFADCGEPDFVKLWYSSGNMSELYLNGMTTDPLDDYFAEAVSWMATARLERPLCTCGNAAALSDRYQTDIAESGEDRSFLVDFDILGNPFGTRIGELMAWKRLSLLTGENRFSAGAI
jgi:hypothetical protein